MKQTFILRAETKEGERRTPITPVHVKQLLAHGHTVYVERSETRCYPDDEYLAAGCSLVEAGAWVDMVKENKSLVVLGLKEQPLDVPLSGNQIYFAHCFKGQSDALEILGRFKEDGGKLFDLEFIVDDVGRRVAAFGRSAGIAGMAVGLLAWCQLKLGGSLGALTDYYDSTELLAAFVNGKIEEACKTAGVERPTAIVIGALGRCGGGACHFAKLCGVKTTDWDLAETKQGGPFPEILEHDLFVNCVYMMQPIPPFVTKDMIKDPNRKLCVVADISCDAGNPNNPVPIYERVNTLTNPVTRIVNDAIGLDITAIDHLPTLIPQESSTEFGNALIETLCAFDENPTSGPWYKTLEVYNERLAQVN